MSILAFALASLVGLSLGLLGGGGAILTVPIFVYVMHLPAKIAVAMSLPVVGAVSAVGALGHWRAGNVDLKRALTFGVAAMAGAFAGAKLSGLVSGTAQLVLLAVLMLGAAASMLRRTAPGERAAGATAPTPLALPVLLPIAAALGVLTGLVGIGGGFLIVPALVVLARMPMKRAIGTSLVVIAMNSAAGTTGYLGQMDLPWTIVLAFTAVAIAGIVAGTRLIRHVPQLALRRAFAVMLVLMGGLMLHQNLGALHASPPSATTTER